MKFLLSDCVDFATYYSAALGGLDTVLGHYTKGGPAFSPETDIVLLTVGLVGIIGSELHQQYELRKYRNTMNDMLGNEHSR